MLDKIKRVYTTIAIIFLNLVILFVIAEAGSTVILYAYEHLIKPHADKQEEQPYKYHPYENLSYFQQQDWGVDWWREHYDAQKLIYQPYVGWGYSVYHGNLINIEESGLRFTPSYKKDNKPSFSIFCFGGSTMWGAGSPDWGTIPAYLAEITNTRYSQYSIDVVNYGRGHVISSQEVLLLIQAIKYGSIPNIVIFYNGVNDVGYAYREKQADVPEPIYVFDALRIQLRQEAEETKTQRPTISLRDLNCIRLVEGVVIKIRGYISPPPAKPPLIAEPSRAILSADIDKLSRDVVSIYLKNMEIVDALSQKYGFDYYFFWQPSLYEESKPLTREEQEVSLGLFAGSPPESAEFRHTVYNLIKSEATKRDHLYYIADVFNDTKEFMFMDGAHIVPEGNRIVAEKIANTITSSIDKRQSD